MIKKIINLISIGMLFISLTFAIYASFLFIQAKQNQTIPKIFGHYLMFVETGSMEPTLPIGTILLVKDSRIQDIKIDDIVSFHSTITLGGVTHDVIITHRVVDIRSDQTGTHLITKGDANELEDDIPVNQNILVGKTILYITFLSFLKDFFGNTSLILFIVVLIVLTLVLVEGANLIKLSVKYKLEKEQDKQHNNNSSHIK